MTQTPFAGGRWTEARYKQFVVSALRKAWMKYPVKQDALEANREDYAEYCRRNKYQPAGRHKWIYRCEACDKRCFGKEVQVDHKHTLGSADNLNQFVGRLFCEVDDLAVLCKGCHRVKTKHEREGHA